MTPSEWRCPVDALASGRTAKFRLRCGGRDVEGFLLRAESGWHAYVNRCPHAGTPLDLWPNEFLTDDGRLFVCATHGALFDPATGACLAGPCAGDALTPMPVRREGEVVVVSCPDGSVPAGSGRRSGPPAP